jgi:hypothetical protein
VHVARPALVGLNDAFDHRRAQKHPANSQPATTKNRRTLSASIARAIQTTPNVPMNTQMLTPQTTLAPRPVAAWTASISRNGPSARTATYQRSNEPRPRKGATSSDCPRSASRLTMAQTVSES